jgi:Domain of unknown function (DUF4388)
VSLAGNLSEYSLAEILHFVQEGNKTGLLSIEPDRGLNRSLSDVYHIACQSGRIMSVVAGNVAQHHGLLGTIEQRRWLMPEKVAGLKLQLAMLRQPLGTHLKSQNLVTAEQLTLLYNAQVIATMCKLFEVNHGRFEFNPKAPLPYSEMTGLNLSAHEVALLGMRMLKDWSGLDAKLPALDSALQRLSSELGNIRLDTQELKVWKLATCEIAIAKIAEQIGLENQKVRQIGFRLSSIGLVQEVSAEPMQPPRDEAMEAPPVCVGGGNPQVPVSASFLSNLMGFLKKKG